MSAAPGARTVRVALVQFDSPAGQVARNLAEMERLSRLGAAGGARWVVFHEGSLCDYTPRPAKVAEPVPAGPSTRRLERLARNLGCFISFGLAEACGRRYHISQVFVGPSGFLYCYRKTWLWREPSDQGYRNEWARFDPGTGPELFDFDGLRATCFICADGDAPRCVQRAAGLSPQVVFYPNNRSALPSLRRWSQLARSLAAPVLVTNRVGKSCGFPCKGGCVAYAADGRILARANRAGREEILFCELEIP